MKVLWLCNVIIPQASEKLGLKSGNVGGWLNQLADILDARDDVELCVCAPYKKGKQLTKVNWGKNSSFWGFQKRIWNPSRYDKSLEVVFKEILEQEKPDIVHIFGTEFPHTLSMVKAFNRPERTVINVQGLCSVIGELYCSGLPSSVVNSWTFRDILRQDNIKKQAISFKTRGKYEIEAIKLANNFLGRTNWDLACIKKMNPKANYFSCNEILRSDFYSGNWDINKIERHSIYFSQAQYPIKGVHQLLLVLPAIIKKYPDAKVYVAGGNPFVDNSLNGKIRANSYSNYLTKILKKSNLKKHIVSLGNISAKEVKEVMLKTNVFVSASMIENESNSLSEARLLGVPCVSSFVGGVTERINHGIDGYFYPFNEPNMLAYYVDRIFSDDELAISFSREEKKSQEKINDIETNIANLIECYKNMTVY